jgi:membrane protein
MAARSWKNIYQLSRKAVDRFIDDDCTTMAAAIAYYTTFSIAPLLLLVISIVGVVFGREAVQHYIQTQVQGLIGEGAATQVVAMIQNAGEHASKGIISGILGFLALLAGATGAFGQLQSSLNRVWHVKPDPRIGGIKNFIGHRILSLGMVLAIAFLLLVSLALSAALSAFGSYISSFLPKGFSAPLLEAIGFAVSLVIIAALFAAMFKVLPDAKIEWRDAWVGAGTTAVLFTAGKYLIGMYLARSATASAYGAAGSFVLIVLWIYYSAMIYLFGAALTAVWTEARKGAGEPKPGAVKVETEEKIQPQRVA